jgi:soluble lytic murein transglycosylase-like protein
VAPVTPAPSAIAIQSPAPGAAEAVARWRPFISEASLRFGVPESWIERVMRAESAGQTTRAGRPIRSRAGAIGLMQLMPATWQAMRVSLGLGDDPDDPRDNILAGTFFLRQMYDRFGYPGLFAAYNAGAGRYAAHLATGQALPAETVAYLAKVDETAVIPGDRPGGAMHDRLFAVRREDAADRPITALFAVKHDVP